MLEVINTYPIGPHCVSVFQLVDAVKELKVDLVAEKIAKVESPRVFSKLLPIFRQASKDQIAQVLKDNTDVL